MRNSEKFKRKMLINKFVYTVAGLLFIFIFTFGIFKKFLPYSNLTIAIILYVFIIFTAYLIVKDSIKYVMRFSKDDYNKIFEELDYKIDKEYDKYGIYITENYIIGIGSKFDFLTSVAVPIKDIDAINTHGDIGHHYRNKKQKQDTSISTFIADEVLNKISGRDNDIYVFNIICGKKVYNLARTTFLRSKKTKDLDEIADYICNKYKDIDYI